MLKIVALLIVIGIVAMIWRLSSKRYLLPCPAWLSWLVELDNPFVKVHQAKTIVRNLELAAGMSVLDVGCGAGRVTIPIAQVVGPNGEVEAMDLQVGMLEKVKQKATKLGLTNIKFTRGEITTCPLMANKYDRIVLVTVLGEIPNQKAALQNIFSALKPGGILSIVETIFDVHFQSQKKVIELAKEIGFVEKQLEGRWFAYLVRLLKTEKQA